MTPEQRKERLRRNLKRQAFDTDKIERDLAYSVFILEKETGHCIGEDYPYFKFLEELEQLNKYKKEEKKEMDGIK